MESVTSVALLSSPSSRHSVDERETRGSRALGVAGVGVEPEHEEQRRERVLALADPGDGLHVQRMQREHPRHEGAAAARAGQPRERGVERERGEDVQRDVGEQVTRRSRCRRARSRAGARAIVSGAQFPRYGSVERRANALPAEGHAQDRVVDDVVGIVVDQELVVPDLRVDGERREREREGGEDVRAARARCRSGPALHVTRRPLRSSPCSPV